MPQSIDVGPAPTTDAAKVTTRKAARAAVQQLHRSTPTADGVAERSTNDAAQLAVLPPWAIDELFRTEGEFARIWAELAGTWMTRSADMRRRLAATGEGRAAVEIHEEFTRDSLGRVAEAVDRCLDLQRDMVRRLLAASTQQQARRVA
jgi:hypothetical protein